MTGWFVTDDERGRRVLHHNGPYGSWPVAARDRISHAVFDAAAAVLAPDDALVERVARALFWFGRADEDWGLLHEDFREVYRGQARAALAAIREEADRG